MSKKKDQELVEVSRSVYLSGHERGYKRGQRDGYDLGVEDTEEYQRGYDAGIKRGRRDQTPPWYHAESGEIWKLSGEAGSGQYIFAVGRFYKLPLDVPRQHPASFCREFSEGELLWSNEYEDDDS